MWSDKNSKGHENTIVIVGVLTIILLGPIVCSGLFLAPLALGICLIVLAWRFWSPRGALITEIILLAMLIYWAYYSDFRGVPLSEWRLIMLDKIAPWIITENPAPRWQIVFLRYVNYSILFSPLGFACWACLAIKAGLPGELWRWIKCDDEPYVPKNEYCIGEDSFPEIVQIGSDISTKKSISLTEDMRLRHTQILGATGYGKTESVLKNLIHNDIGNGRGLLLIDGKGDADLRDQIITVAREFNRFEDIRYFNYSDSVRGMTYNPVLNGSATEIRDRIIDALDWSEEYYKKCASSALLLALQIFEHQHEKPTLAKIVGFLMNPGVFPGVVPSELSALYKDFRENHAKRLPEIKGLITDLNNLILSGGGKFLSEESPEINLLTAVREKRIVIMQVSTLDFGMTARAFGRLVIQDLKAVCGIINRDASSGRDLFSVYIDEFESFAHESFNELLSKARGAGIGITICHQSMGDLEKIGPFFQKQITENTNNKIILHVNDEETVEYFANMAGTKQTKRTTYQVEEDIFGTRKTGVGSRRDVEEFIIHPNAFRNLKIGEAVVMTRNTGKTHVVKLNRLPRYESSHNYVEYFHEQARQTESRPQLGEELASKALRPLSKVIF